MTMYDDICFLLCMFLLMLFRLSLGTGAGSLYISNFLKIALLNSTLVKDPRSRLLQSPDMPRQDEKAAPAAEPGRRRRRFSKFKPFGLKMFLKYRPTEESGEEAADTAGMEMTLWAEGE